MTARDMVDESEAVVRVAPIGAGLVDLSPGRSAMGDPGHPRRRWAVGRSHADSDAREAAFLDLARRHLDDAYRLARTILGDAAEAEDATHDAFVQAWQRWPSLRDPLRFEPWFHRILLNTCRNRLRRRRRWSIVDISEELHPRLPDPDLEAVDDRQLIGAALSRMGPDDRLILALRFYLDLSVDEIARRLGIRQGTVKSRLHYSLRRLQSTLDESGELETLR